MDSQELFELKERLDAADRKVSEVKGQLNYLTKELHSKWKCRDLKSAKKMLKEMEQKEQILAEKVQKRTSELETALKEVEI